MTEPAQSVPADDPATTLDKNKGLTTASLAGAQPPGEASVEAPTGQGGEATPLFSTNETSELRGRWDNIQTGFVDEPRKAVEEADGLVAAAMKRLAEIFAQERAGLEGQWTRGGDVSTEDLRQALRRYRSFFTRLLSV
jgi:hypothetical protein